MDKQTLKKLLIENHEAFSVYMLELTDEQFCYKKEDKWTAGQQLEHIYLSVKPVRQVLTLPTLMLQLIWGKTNRKSRSYDELIKKYQLKLENGGRASGRFIPKNVNIEKRQQIINVLKKEVESLCSKLDKLSDTKLDKYVLPHPLLGKLTLREMMYFTVYHVQHHHEITKRNLS